MPDSLVIGHIELLGGGVPSTHPMCAGAIFRLAPGWDLSAPQPAADTVASLLLGGGLPLGQHVDNRNPKLPIVIYVPSTGSPDNDRTTLAGAREVLMQAVNADRWPMIWAREGGLAMVFDCFHAAPAVVTYSLPLENALISEVEVSFTALPYGRSDESELIPFNSPSTGWVMPPPSVTLDDFNTTDNWLNGDDTGFEAGLGHWIQNGNCAIAQSAAQAHSGTGSLRLTSSAAGAMQATSAGGPGVQLSVLPGDTVHSNTWFRAATAARSCNAGVDFFDINGGYISTLRGSNITDSTSVWTQATATVTAPPLAAYAEADPQVLATAAGGEVHYIDDVTLDRGPIYSTTDFALFSQSTVAALGTRSLRWARTSHSAPNYTRMLPAPVSIAGLKRLTFFLGLGTGTYSQWHTGRITATCMLTDAGGNTVTCWITHTVKASGLITAPYLQKISGLIPQVTSFDYTNVVSYQLQVWNKIETVASRIPSGQQQPVLQAEAYFDTLRADAASTGSPGPRGAIYIVPGAVGTAPAALTMQIQPGPSTVQQTATFTTVGSNNWTAPAGVTNVLQAYAVAGTSGGAGAGSDGGSGAGGAESATEFNIPVTALSVYHPVVGAAGTPGGTVDGAHQGGWGTISTFLGNGGFGVTAHPGQPGGLGGSASVAGEGGTGSSNSVHYPGGDGKRITSGINRGGGGGGSGGTGAPGRDANTGPTNEWQGAAAVDGGGPGGNGGRTPLSPHGGQSPASGPGGGGGGGSNNGGTRSSGGAGASGLVRLVWAATAALPIKTAVVHLPPRDSPSSIAPMITTGNGTDVPNGATTYTAPVTGALQARYSGTYQVLLTSASWNSPTASRTVTVNVIQHKADGTTLSVPLARTFIPNTDPDHINLLNGLVMMGTVYLPLAPISPGNNTDLIQATVNDTNGSDRFYDTLLLSTEGQTVIYSSSGSGVNNLWITEPDIGIDYGQVYGSQADWDQASSVLSDCPVIAGGPIAVLSGENQVLIYSVQGAPAVQASYQPRWHIDRLQ